MSEPYFAAFEERRPPRSVEISPRRLAAWQLMAGLTVGFGLWYLHWRWTGTLNPRAPVFSSLVAGAETLMFIGTLLFFHDIWRPASRSVPSLPKGRAGFGLRGEGPVRVDVFVTTKDEGPEILRPTLEAARALRRPPDVEIRVWVLDDGRREEIRQLAAAMGCRYLTRPDSVGFKAGNLRNALLASDGDFFVIADADTRLFPGFVENTLGHFRDRRVAWVQTPHWFYDLPEGEEHLARLRHGTSSLGRAIGRLGAAALALLTGRERSGRDPFLSDPGMFFDVIQRRRDRNLASFCCGAASIHRREAVAEGALRAHARDRARLARRLRWRKVPARLVALQPFRFHVSEDIYTSMLFQQDRARRWHGRFHPWIESRMLSPWTVRAWAAQRLKYAGGTFDIMFRDNPLWRRGMPLATRLHYAATFWSYLSLFWIAVLLVAPAVALMTGWSPVQAEVGAFFAHLLPVLFANEIALILACKGHDFQAGRVLGIVCLPINALALAKVLAGRRIAFRPTPKTPVIEPALRMVLPHVLFLALAALAVLWALAGRALGAGALPDGMLVANLFWLGWNCVPVARFVRTAVRPPVPPRPAAPAPAMEIANAA